MDTQIADVNFERLADIYANRLGAFVSPGEPFALMDFPAHDNVGDSAIYVGELAFLDSYVGQPPSFVNTCNDDPADIQSTFPEGPILIHGGGNFGDIWRNHQRFRLRAFETLKGRPLVQLPQSVHFDDVSARDETARAIEAHGQVTLFVRDEFSFEFARKHFQCDVIQCPDAAVNIRYLPSPDPQVPVLNLVREDKEAAWGEVGDLLCKYGDVADWPSSDVWSLWERALQKLFLPMPQKRMAHREAIFRRHANLRLQSGVRLLSKASWIVSDRLHAHLIASLMRRPHIVLDNKYGKIARHISVWGDFGLAHSVKDRADLQDALNRLVRSSGC